MAIKKYEKNGQVLYRVRVTVFSNDRSVCKQRQQSNVTSLIKAKQIEKDLAQRATIEAQANQGSTIILKNLCKQYLEYRRDDRLEPIEVSTLKDYVSTIKKWLRPLYDIKAVNISENDLREVLARMKDEGLSTASQLKLKNLIGRIYRWGKQQNIIPYSSIIPTEYIKIVHKNKKVPTYHTYEQTKTLLEEGKDRGHEWAIVWHFACATGMRSGEIFALRWDHIISQQNILRVRESYSRPIKGYKTTKSGDWRDVPIEGEVKKVLDLLKELNGDSEFIMPKVKGWDTGTGVSKLKKFCDQIGVPKIIFHDFRSFFCTTLLNKGIPLAQIMRIGGWKDLKTMQRYIRMAGIEVQGVLKDYEL